MTAGLAEITKARAGTRFAIVEPNYSAAQRELERLAELAVDATQVIRSNGQLAIRFVGGGLLRIGTAATDPHRIIYDEVVVHPNAWTADLEERYQPSLATTGGKVRVADSDDAAIR